VLVQHRGDDATNARVVVDDEDPSSPEPTRMDGDGFLVGGVDCRVHERQVDPEDGALARFAVDGDRPLALGDDPVDGREPQTGALTFRLGRDGVALMR
jgi:hypothetical protein